MGTILGLIIALLAMGVGALFFFANTGNDEIVPVAVPDVESGDTADIELPDVQVDVPDVQIDVPEVNITEAAPDESAAE